MKGDCHMHMVLDGVNWRTSIGRGVDDGFIRQALQTYKDLGYRYLRDGGDRFGVGKRARALSGEYGITYRTPLAPLHKLGHYGGFIGRGFADLREFAALVRSAREDGADFIKIMISGLMDFDRFGVLTEAPLPDEEIRELIHIAHAEGFAVMVHCNGAGAIRAAAAAGVDSVEHGAYADGEALAAMAESGTVWVPTLSTIGNLLGKGRFDDGAVRKILDCAMENLSNFVDLGGIVAPGSDAGAWAVPHGCDTEAAWLEKCGVDGAMQQAGLRRIMEKF